MASEKKSLRDRVKALVESNVGKQLGPHGKEAWGTVLLTHRQDAYPLTESGLAALEAHVTFLERLLLSSGEYPLSGETRWRLLMGLFGREALLVNEFCPDRVRTSFDALSSWEPADGREFFPEGASREVEAWVLGLRTASWEARSLQEVDLLRWSRERQTVEDRDRVTKVLGAISAGRDLWSLSGDTYFAWLEVSAWARIGGADFPHGYVSLLEDYLRRVSTPEAKGRALHRRDDPASMTSHYGQMVADLQGAWAPPLDVQEALDALPADGTLGESLSIEHLQKYIPVLEAAVAEQLVLRRVKFIRDGRRLREEGERFRSACQLAVEALRGRENVPPMIQSAALYLQGYLLDSLFFRGSEGRERMRSCLSACQSWLSDPARTKK